MEKISSILSKLVLSVQVIMAFISIIGVIFHIVVGVHDVALSHNGKECIMRNSRGDLRSKLKKTMQYDSLIEDIVTKERSMNDGFSPTAYLIEEDCSQYFKIVNTEWSSFFYVKTWYESKPVTWKNKLEIMSLFILIPVVLILLLQVLKVWTRWLLK